MKLAIMKNNANNYESALANRRTKCNHLKVASAAIYSLIISSYNSGAKAFQVNSNAALRSSHKRPIYSSFGNTVLYVSDEREERPLLDKAPCLDNGVCGVTTDGDVGEAISRISNLSEAPNPTVWSEFGRLSQQYEVANLGQGFPDWTPPQFALDSLVEAALDDSKTSPHQYTRTAGHPNLVQGLAGRYSIHLQREIDPMNEVAVTVGASQALYLSLQTLIKPGDEVILFEPFFDLYVNQVKLAGGTPVYVPLTFVPYELDDGTQDIIGGEWILDSSRLMESISSKTRAIVLNSPHNPTGKVFTLKEMETIASAVVEAGPQCVVLSDEVYKYILHAPPKEDESVPVQSSIASPGHIHFASLPNMWDRTITISSAGKTFSATGWQVGWCVGPEHLIAPIHQLLPYVQFCASTVMQEALARTLQKADTPYKGYSSYYEFLKETYTRKRDLLRDALKLAGFGVPNYDVTPGGGFFIFARIGKSIANALPQSRIRDDNNSSPNRVRQDWALCRWMAEEKGLLCIPSTPFFSEERVSEGASDEFIRVAFCKTDEVINDAARALLNLKSNHAETCEESVVIGSMMEVEG